MTRAQKGFSLLELIAVLAIMTILYSMMPALMNPLRGTQGRRAQTDIAMLAEGLWGPSPDYQGFVGDVGITDNGDATVLQTDGLEELLVFPATGGTFSPGENVAGVTAGWNGPYAGFEPNALRRDPWTRDWEILANGQIRSFGPDGIAGTADDLYAPVAGPLDRGNTSALAITVRDVEGRLLNSTHVDVIVWTPEVAAGSTPRGQKKALPLTYDPVTNAFLIENLTPGRHLVEVAGKNDLTTMCDGATPGSCIGLYGQGVAFAVGGALANLEVRLHP